MATEKYLLDIAVSVQNDRAIAALTKQLDQAAKTAPAATRAMQPATKSTAAFGRAAQNTSYQLQDFIVQVQGGVDPLRAMSQQLPQMTVGMGAYGAAIGLVAAALPALIQIFKDTEKVTADLDTSLSALNVSMNTFDTDSFVEQFNKATEADRKFLEQRLRTNLQIAKDASSSAAADLVSPINLRGGGASAVSSLGLPIPVFAQNIDLLKEFEASGGTNLELLQKMRDLYIQTGEEQGGLNKAGQAYLESLFAMEEALKATAAAQKALSDAQAAGATGIIGGGSGGTGGGGALQEVEVMAQRARSLGDIMVEINDYNQMMQEYQDGPPWAGWGESAEAEFSMIGHATELVSTNMDTMFNGVLMGTRDVGDAFKDMAKVIIAQLLKIAAYQAIAGFFPGTSIGNAAASLLPNAKGNAFGNGNVLPFARGGVVSSPTLFPMAKGAGLMGEAGPEGILPLKRTRTGDLGVQASGMSVIINNMAPGVEARPRQTDRGTEIDLVLNAVAADLARGGGPVSQTLERTYGVGRGRGVY